MTSAKIDQLRLDVEELERLSDLTSRQGVKNLLLLDVSRVKTEITNLEGQLVSEKANTKTGAPSTSTTASTNRCYNVKINNYCWDQTPKDVKVIVTLPGVDTLPEGSITCKFTKRSMNLQVNGLDNKNHNLSISNLCRDINPDKSTFKVKGSRVTVILVKAVEDRWSDVVSSDKIAKPQAPDFKPSDDPSQSLMEMMKKMYEEGDDDMKRTIAKAWMTKGNPSSDVMLE